MILRLKCDLHTTHSREVNTSDLLTSREAEVSLWLLMWCISERNRLWGQKTQKWAWLYTHGVSGGRQWFGSAGPMTYGARPRGVIETVGCDSLTVCCSTAESSSSSRRRCEPASLRRRYVTEACYWKVLRYPGRRWQMTLGWNTAESCLLRLAARMLHHINIMQQQQQLLWRPQSHKGNIKTLF